MAIKWFVKLKKRARGIRPALRGAAPGCEPLEPRQLLAAVIRFNPTGTPSTQPLTIGGIDEAPGNALARASLPLTVGRTFQLDYQAIVGGLVDVNGLTLSPPGLNTDYQVTAVASFTEVVTSADAAAGTATFGLAPVQAPASFFELYYNPAAVADNRAGTGFNVGTRILSGRPSLRETNSGNFAIQKGPAGVPVIQPFDQFNDQAAPGILTVTGTGSSLIQVDVASIDPAFFLDPVASLSFNTLTTAPFTVTDPSLMFVEAPGGAPPSVAANVGAVNGVTGPDFQFQADANSSFTLPAPAIAIAKATNGVVAPAGPGPVVAVGSAVGWTYDVTNPGNEPLRNVSVVDDAGTPGVKSDDFAPSPVLGPNGRNVGDANGDGLLDPGEDWKYAATGVARAGQYENRVATAAAGNLSGTPVTAGSISHYFAAAPAIAIAKATNGVVAPAGPGPVVAVGSAVGWTYDVTNPGNEPLRNVSVVDDAGTPGVKSDDFAPSPVLGPNGRNVGDANGDGLLDPGEDWKYAATGVARAGQYENRVATAAAGNLSGTPVTAGSISHYFAAAPAIAIAKATNGVVAPAGPGPVVAVGSAVGWTYDVTNPGNEPLRNVSVVDDAGTPGVKSDDFAPSPVLGPNGRNVGDANGDGLLDPGEDWKYAATGVARAGQYENRVATAAAGGLSGTPVTAGSISHYFAEVPTIAVVKATNGVVAPTGTGPVVTAGSVVTFSYFVTNPGRFPLNNVVLSDDAGTPNNPVDDLKPTFVGGDANGNGQLDPGETWVYSATQLATSGQYTNFATVVGFNPSGVPVAAQTPGHYFGVCPMVINVQRSGVHLQPTQVVVSFDRPLNPTQAANLADYRLFAIGRDGRFDVPDQVVSAVYNPSNFSVTLTAEHRLNVHHLSRIEVTNPCPGGPAFDGILNRKFSLGAVTIIGRRGHHFVFPPSSIPAVLNPAILPDRLIPSNRAATNRLSTKPESGAFFHGVGAMGVGEHPTSPQVRVAARIPKAPARHA